MLADNLPGNALTPAGKQSRVAGVDPPVKTIMGEQASVVQLGRVCRDAEVVAAAAGAVRVLLVLTGASTVKAVLVGQDATALAQQGSFAHLLG